MKSKKIKQLVMLAVAVTCFSIIGISQPGGPGPGNPGAGPDPSVPLDLGLTAFVVAGLGYAAKKRMDMKKGHHPVEKDK